MILKPNLLFLLLTSIWLMPAISNAATTVNKCRDAAGHLTFTDQPCKASDVNEAPAVATPSSPESPQTSDKPSTPETGGTPPSTPDVYKRPDPVVVPPLPKADLSGLPKDAQGHAVLIQTEGASLVAESQEKPNAVNFLARCSVLVTNCVKRDERSLDACFMSAPRCTSSRPWENKAEENSECCVAECWKRYEKARVAGKASFAAFDEVLFGKDSCITGVSPAGVSIQ